MLADAIDRWARESPDRTAIIHNGHAMSYAAFARGVHACRRFLAGQGLPAGGTAVIAAESLRDAWLLVLGLRATGLDTICAPSVQHVEALGLRTPACIVSTEAERSSAADTGRHRTVIVPAAIFAALGSGEPGAAAPLGARGGGHILHTSGSTGGRKKVLIGAAIEDRANADRARLSSFGADFVHNSLDFGLWTGAGYRPASAVWHVGGCVVLDQRADRHDRIFDHGVDRVGVMPETLRELATAQNARRRDVVIQTSGAALPLDVAQATVQRLTDRLLFTYSATEFFMAPAFAWFRGPDDLNWLRPEEGRVIQVVDEHGRECPPGVQGLVRIRLREFDVQSYIEDEQATARAFRDGFCYPGDLGVMRADGRVRLLGRDGDVINIGGQKIPAALIEEGLQGALRVEEVCVFAGPLDSGGQELVIALKTDRDPPPYELAPLAREFESFERVRVAVFEAFPKNVSGMRKTSRPELRKLAFAAAREIGR